MNNSLKNQIKIFKNKINEEKKQFRSEVQSYLLEFGTFLHIFDINLTIVQGNAKDIANSPGLNTLIHQDQGFIGQQV